MSHKYTILCVDNDMESLSLLVTALSPKYDVITSSNAVEGFNLLATTDVDLVISGAKIQSDENLAHCRALYDKSRVRLVPAIMIVGVEGLRGKSSRINYYADVCLRKPFRMELLKKCVELLLVEGSSRNEGDTLVADNKIPVADKEFLENFKTAVEENLHLSDFNLDKLSSLLGVSRSGLNRKVRIYLSTSPNDYIKEERLKKAASLIREGKYRISEVSYMTGFSSPSYFTKCFRERFNYAPKEATSQK